MLTQRVLPFYSVLALVLVAGCSDSDHNSNGGEAASAGDRITATLPVSMQLPVSLTAGVPAAAAAHFEVPGDFDWGTLTQGSFDLATTVTKLTVVRTDGGASQATPSLALSLKVAAGDAVAGGCGGGVEVVGATVTGDASFANLAASAGEVALSQAALDLVNSGSFTLCGSVTSSVDANITLSGLAVDFGFDSGCDIAQDVAGLWVGDYSCDNVCQGGAATESGQVEIAVTQAGETAIYSDGTAVYIGSVCESTFRHLGFGGTYVEYGSFTRTGATTATKSSTWMSIVTPDCGGTCMDSVTFTPQ